MNTKKCLIITDVQKDFCPGGSLAVERGDIIVPVINKILSTKKFDKIIATQDWHPQNHRSFASNNAGHKAFDIVKSSSGINVLWPDHCVQGTYGAQFHDALDQNPLNIILRKGSNPELDSYSTFLENDKTTPTGLTGYLREHGITTVYLCGIASDVCVFYSALDAIHFGFKTFVIEDAVAGVDLPLGNIERNNIILKNNGVIFINSRNI
ncbi:MAG: bifunctional nicotinamidase/pyrazinamidase [Candidatus Marinimicrobia bacterium]|nr:bifunctional nicotinamidase/pyrazinamidase [Candidatus Neomarinimicrobiota bacterium]